MLFVSDIHASWMFPPRAVAALTGQMAALKPDLILYGGDFAESWGSLQSLMSALRALEPPLGAYTVLGNNDEEAARHRDLSELTALLEHEGHITPLIDTEAVVTVGANRIRLFGLQRRSERTTPLQPFFENSTDRELRILMAHYPWHLADAEAAWRGTPHLALSGHTHGGQIRLFGLTPYSLGYELRMITRELGVDGWTDAMGFPTLVSRGVGTSKLPFRVNATPVIHLIELA